MHTSMPAEFFLPPATEAELWRETAASTLRIHLHARNRRRAAPGHRRPGL